MVLTAPLREWGTPVPRRRHDDDPGVLARILYRMRQESGMTQREIQRRAGWADGNSYYSDIERGNVRLPGKDKIADLERAFGVEPGAIEDQLPRREKFMLEEPANVMQFPDPDMHRITLHVQQIRTLDARKIIDIERYLLALKEDIYEQQERTGGEGRQDTEPGTNAPGA